MGTYLTQKEHMSAHLTSVEYKRLFKLLNDYASRHNSLLTELFLDEDESRYFTCFRPQGTGLETPNRYKCVYATITAEEARDAAITMVLNGVVAAELDRKLKALEGLP